MHFWKIKVVFLGGMLVGAGIFFPHTKLAHASALLNNTFAATAPTATVGTIRQVRVDPIGDTVYVLGNNANVLGAISADGTSFSSIAYSAPVTAVSGSDFAVSNGRLFIVTSGAGSAIYRFDVSGSIASFVASSTLGAGTNAVTYPGGGTVYTSRSSIVNTFDTNLINLSTTNSSSTIARLAYGGNNLYYLGLSGRFARLVLGISDTTLATGGPSAGTARSLVASNDGSALYYASNSALGKLSVSSGSVLWTINISNLAGMDVSTSTGRITLVNTSGSVMTYNPINPVSGFSASASGTSAILNWTTGVSDSDFSGVTIRRSTSSYPTNVTDGIAVTSSDVGTTLTDTGLSDGTYYYGIFNQTADGYYSAAVTSTVTIDLPPDAPALAADATGSTITLSWSVPADTASFVLRRSTTSFPSSYTDATAVITTASTVTSLTEMGMPDGTYYYSLFAADSGGNYSSAGTASATIDTTAPSAPSGFLAVASGSSISLTWSNPLDADFASSTIRRSTTGFPTSTTDGTAVTSTGATNYTDSSLADGTYYYSIFAADITGNASTAATSSATVNTYVPSPAPVTSGGGGVGSVAIAPSGINAAPLRFFVSNGSSTDVVVTVSSPAITLRLNANPASVRGYAASLDSLFTNASIFPLSLSGDVTFVLPDKAGTYTVYLKYYSTTGQSSSVLSQSVTYAPVLAVSSALAQSASSRAPRATNTAYVFTRVLRQGNRGADVKALQVFLNMNGFLVAKNGQGSPNHETTFFGSATKNAVKEFQEAYKDMILKPYNLEKGTGILGVGTMAFINAKQ